MQKFFFCSSGQEFLDTECLRNLSYGNLVLRHQMHLFLGCGVIFSLVLLLLFWLVTFNIDYVACGRRSSGSAAFRESCELVTTMVQFAPPPALASSPVAVHPVTLRATSSQVGKIVEVRETEIPPEHPSATQSEIKQGIENQSLQNVVAGTGSGTGTGGGGESSGLEGFGEEGAIFGACEKMPGFLEQKKTVYPEAARIAGITGRVLVKVLIEADGHPIKAMIVKRIPAETTVFDTVALTSVLDSTYYPAIQNGQPVKVWCIIPINFRLK
ncbi:MAG: energy transducer TonB [Chlorobium sp.]